MDQVNPYLQIIAARGADHECQANYYTSQPNDKGLEIDTDNGKANEAKDNKEDSIDNSFIYKENGETG